MIPFLIIVLLLISGFPFSLPHLTFNDSLMQEVGNGRNYLQFYDLLDDKPSQRFYIGNYYVIVKSNNFCDKRSDV